VRRLQRLAVNIERLLEVHLASLNLLTHLHLFGACRQHPLLSGSGTAGSLRRARGERLLLLTGSPDFFQSWRRETHRRPTDLGVTEAVKIPLRLSGAGEREATRQQDGEAHLPIVAALAAASKLRRARYCSG
jgi:hypothetical protein